VQRDVLHVDDEEGGFGGFEDHVADLASEMNPRVDGRRVWRGGRG
jgi:hypothetical protein